jgi:hypothetical protein
MMKRIAIKALKLWIKKIELERRLYLRALCAVSPEAGQSVRASMKALQHSMLTDAERRYCELEGVEPAVYFQARR